MMVSQNRRVYSRCECTLPVSSLEWKGAVVDLSVGGARIFSRDRLEPGATIELERGAGPTVAGQVRWVLDHPTGCVMHGVTFSQSAYRVVASWVGEVLSKRGLTFDGLLDRRRFVRWDARLEAEMEAGEVRCRGEICELSTGGARFLTDQRPEVADQAMVSVHLGHGGQCLPEARLVGVLQEHGSNFYCLRFEHHLDGVELRELCQA